MDTLGRERERWKIGRRKERRKKKRDGVEGREEEPAFSEIIVLAISVSQRHRARFICRVYCR